MEAGLSEDYRERLLSIYRETRTPRANPGYLRETTAITPGRPGLGVERHSIEFIDENGGGPGVRLKKRQQKKR